jgi:hypothetical protein
MLIVEAFTSKIDVNGNTYTGIKAENTLTGKSAIGRISGGRSNVWAGLRELFGDWSAVHEHAKQIENQYSIREFNRLVKNTPYAGCTPDEIAKWITDSVGPVKRSPKLSSKKTRQIRRIEQHGLNLIKIFPQAAAYDPIELCSVLRRIETQAAAIGLRMCNGPEFAEGEADKLTDKILDKLNKILGHRAADVPVFINRDPRGHALKIDDVWMRENGATLATDWGGYGLLCPEITGD